MRLRGHVRLDLGPCRLRAAGLRLDFARRVLQGEQVELQGLRAEELRLGPGGALEASGVRGSLCACSTRAPLRLTAARARIAAGGRRLHLRWPVLRVGPVPVMVLPYIALPLERGVSGLLLPEVGYSGRDGVRLLQGAYLAPWAGADLLGTAGWIQSRGVQGRVRLRMHQGPGDLELQADGLRDGDWNRGQLQGRGKLGGETLALGFAGYLSGDPGLPSVLEQAVDRVFAPYQRGRAWARGASGALHGDLRLDLLQQLLVPAMLPHGRAGLVRGTVGIGPVRLAGPLMLMMDAGMDHISSIPLTWDAARGAGEPRSGAERSAQDEAGRGQATRVQIEPALAMAQRLGPAQLSALGRYHLDLTRTQNVAAGGEVLQAVVTQFQTSVPLARRFGGKLHVVEPLVGLRWSAWQSAATTVDGAEVVDGGLVSLGARTELLGERSTLALQTTVDLPLDRSDGRAALLGGLLRLHSQVARGDVRVAWEPAGGRLTQLTTRACLGPWRGLRACGAYDRLRLMQVDDLIDVTHAAGSWIQGVGVVPLALRMDQASVGLDGAWGPLAATGQVAWDPVRRQLAYGSLAVSLAPGCGCYRVGVTGAMRAGQRWPDLSLSLAITPADLRCW